MVRLVANAVQHAEGDPASDLHFRRPESFIAPEVAGLPLAGSETAVRVFQPVMRKNSDLSVDDMERRGSAVEQFWPGLSDAMARAKSGHPPDRPTAALRLPLAGTLPPA